MLFACRPQSNQADGANEPTVRNETIPMVRSSSAPASAQQLALLDGLGVGDELEGYEMVWIGAVRADGGMEIRLEAGGQRMRLVIALISDTPRPPVRTEKYGLYYEGLDVTHAAGEEESLRVLEALAKRVRNVEAKVPTPAGLGQLRPPSTPL